MRLRFLGTGAAGGTPGKRRSARCESSVLLEADGYSLLIDVTRDYAAQSHAIERLDAVLLTHAHRDACGGIACLRGWWAERQMPPVPVYAAPRTLDILRARFRRLDHCRFQPVAAGRRRRVGPFAVVAAEVPHARETNLPTFAWRLEADGQALVYASDVARLTKRLEQQASGVALLVIDGAMWRRQLFSHLTIDAALPTLCRWDVDRILLTQIGRTAPPHEQLVHEAARLCHRAAPAHDGMIVELEAAASPP